MPRRRLEMDEQSLKALAHPMRVQILRILQLHKRASATSLAEQLGETTGATSYHLRQLARHGFVEPFEVEPEGTARAGRKQQWWRMAVDEIHMSGFDMLADDQTREAAGFLLREYQADRGRRLANWHATATQWPPRWQRASSDMDGHLELNPSQTARAGRRARRRGRSGTAEVEPGRGARTIDVQYAVFPADTGDRP